MAETKWKIQLHFLARLCINLVLGSATDSAKSRSTYVSLSFGTRLYLNNALGTADKPWHVTTKCSAVAQICHIPCVNISTACFLGSEDAVSFSINSFSDKLWRHLELRLVPCLKSVSARPTECCRCWCRRVGELWGKYMSSFRGSVSELLNDWASPFTRVIYLRNSFQPITAVGCVCYEACLYVDHIICPLVCHIMSSEHAHANDVHFTLNCQWWIRLDCTLVLHSRFLPSLLCYLVMCSTGRLSWLQVLVNLLAHIELWNDTMCYTNVLLTYIASWQTVLTV